MQIELEPVQGQVMLAFFSTFIMNIILVSIVIGAREKYGVKQPNLQAPDSHPHKQEFNCAQRAHQNTLEQLPLVQVLTLIMGLWYPILASSFCLVFCIGRVIQGYSYSQLGASSRALGFVLSFLGGQVALTVLAGYHAGKLLECLFYTHLVDILKCIMQNKASSDTVIKASFMEMYLERQMKDPQDYMYRKEHAQLKDKNDNSRKPSEIEFTNDSRKFSAKKDSFPIVNHESNYINDYAKVESYKLLEMNTRANDIEINAKRDLSKSDKNLAINLRNARMDKEQRNKSPLRSSNSNENHERKVSTNLGRTMSNIDYRSDNRKVSDVRKESDVKKDSGQRKDSDQRKDQNKDQANYQSRSQVNMTNNDFRKKTETSAQAEENRNKLLGTPEFQKEKSDLASVNGGTFAKQSNEVKQDRKQNNRFDVIKPTEDMRVRSKSPVHERDYSNVRNAPSNAVESTIDHYDHQYLYNKYLYKAEDSRD